MSLNSRHKAGLFVALAVTGLSLFLELSAKQTAGIALLGVAFAWLFGTLSLRTLGLISFVVMSVLGFYLAAAPVWGDWKSFRDSAGEYDSAIDAVLAAIVKAPRVIEHGGTTHQFPHGVTQQEVAAALKGWDAQAGNRPPPPHGYYDVDAVGAQAGATTSNQDELDVVQHPTLGTLKFPKSMPFDQRNRIIKDMEQKQARAVSSADAKQKGKRAPIREGTQAPQYEIVDPEQHFRETGQRFEVVPPESNQISVQIPEAAEKLVRPGQQDRDWFAQHAPGSMKVEFPGKMSDLDIMREFKTKILRPRPAFSLAAALSSHLWSLFSGIALLASGLVGCAWLLWRRPAKELEA